LPEHFIPAIERGISLQNAEIDAIIHNTDAPTFDNTIRAFDASGIMLHRTALILEMLVSSDATAEMQAVEEQAMPLLAAHNDAINMNKALFERIRQVYEHRDAESLDAEQLRLVEKLYTEFVRSGALLDEAGQQRLKAINAELSTLSVRYGNNILAENDAYRMELTVDQLDGLPNSVRESARETAKAMGLDDKYYVFTLRKSSLLPFLTYSKERALRQQLYTAYLERCAHDDAHDNRPLVNDYIRLRTEKAHLLGYDSYAAYITADEMARTPKAVYELLESIWTPALERAKAELADMETLLHDDDASATFASWDWWYYAEKIRRRNYALDDEALRPYFSLENVQNGIFFLANRLYGITFRPVVVPQYNADCVAYQVLDEDESHLGIIYFDYYEREGKSGGAWCGNFTEQYFDADGTRVAPVVGVVTNYAKPTASSPTLLNIDETQTLFHEFGHALHDLFRQVKYRGLSDVEGDFVELPSQVMENWAMEPEMLEQYALHYRTNEKMSRSLMQKIQRSAQFNKGFDMTELLAAALTDMDIHSITSYTTLDVAQFEHDALTRRGLIAQIEPRYHYPYFSHIFDGGYSAGYYFYIWAQVLDKDAFNVFKSSGDLFNRKVAQSFRRLLSRGGEADGMTLYRDFCGHEPGREPLLRACGFLPDESAVATELSESADDFTQTKLRNESRDL
jgi:peptidyl-dipeptidase Dcp